MAAFSYQHPHPFHLDSSSVLLPMEEGNFFIYPPKFPTQNQQIIINNPLDGGVFESSRVDHHSDNEPSYNNSAVTKNQSTTVSSTEQVTQSTVTHMNKKRKSRTNGSSLNSAQSKQPREVKVKKQKKSNDAKEKKNPKADEKKVSEEPPKDYIHVRARRGQATDSHSLAERVRREKISERMKILEKLVPGCDKVTGKALVLDEIINYVQYLQNQVEFLSMELASINPMFYDCGIDLDNIFMVRADEQRLNSIAASAPMLQCSPTTQLTAFAEATTAAAFNPPADHNNNPILDTAILLQQEQMLNAFISQDNGSSLLWDVEDQKQKFLNPSVFTNNLCSFH